MLKTRRAEMLRCLKSNYGERDMGPSTEQLECGFSAQYLKLKNSVLTLDFKSLRSIDVEFMYL